MVAFKTVKAGDVLWDVRRERAGNTLQSRVAIRPVRVIEVKASSALVSWNHNPPREWRPKDFVRLRRKRPQMKH